ncbi:MAG: MBL fold metallo-hydrolase [Anaerolineae bacterium]|nr:MBL fold metallo-hydrolase [Anaerolineae bacterium]
MNITLLGTGTPILETDRQGSAVLVQLESANLLFDCGRGVNTQLLRAGLSPADVDVVFITHHHADHIGDLGDVLIAAWHGGRSQPFHVYGPQGTAAIVNGLFEHIYAREIAFSMRLEEQLDSPLPDIRDIVQVHDIVPGPAQETAAYRVLSAYVDHGSALMPTEEWPCLGYRVEAGGATITLSGDTIPCDGLELLAQDADVLVQCCYLAEAEVTSPAFEFLSRYVIASSGQVGKLAARARVKKLVLTHFRQKSDALMQSLVEDIRQDYTGEVILGADLMRIPIG